MFRSQKPEDIVRIQLRRHRAELDFPTARTKKNVGVVIEEIPVYSSAIDLVLPD